MQTIILLDLNYTLVENSRETFDLRYPDIERETYRTWLIQLIREHIVCLITTRNDSLEGRTLRHIDELTGWKPDHTFFKPYSQRYTLRAPEYKRGVLVGRIVPQFGRQARYLALESNHKTRAMYATLGVKAVRVLPEPWQTLPDAEFIGQQGAIPFQEPLLP